jgi:uncharacterized protein YgbK (DUF1537 family)
VSISGPLDAVAVNVLAVSTESRDLGSDAARDRLAVATSRLPWRSARILFKKIDSTMRGNVAAEIAAAIDRFECDVAVVCPAFPALRRVVEAGRLRVDREDFEAVDVAALLRDQGLERSVYVQPRAMNCAMCSNAQAMCLDAVCDQDLDQIAAEASALNRRILWVGSGGLSAALARMLPFRHASGRPSPTKGPVLLCIGSDHPVTTAQLEALTARRQVLMARWDQASRQEIIDTLTRGRHVCLSLPRGQVCSEHLRELIAGVPAAAIFLSGGDTASLVCNAVGTHYIDLYDEIVSGIPYGVLDGGDFAGATVVTKSGGFGRADGLIQVADYFLCPNQ